MTDIIKLPRNDSQLDNVHDSQSLGSQVSALWHDAYEHRGALAAVAAGAAVTGAVYAAEHTSLGRALGLAKNVLVIEDTEMFSRQIKRSLANQGENVTVLKGIHSLKPFVGILEDDSTRAINLHKVKAAFVDGDLVGELRGPDIVPALRNKNVFTVAMSSEKPVNDEMRALGAGLGAPKPVVMQMLWEDYLRLPYAIRDPVNSQTGMDDLWSRFLEPSVLARRKELNFQMTREFGSDTFWDRAPGDVPRPTFKPRGRDR
jgi:hypothetical protein